MSSSSSTMRTSDAISDPFLLIFKSFFVVLTIAGLLLLLGKGEGQRDFRSLPASGVAQGNVAAMVFHDLAHNGEPQPRTLGAGGDIGFGQTVAMFRRQT